MRTSHPRRGVDPGGLRIITLLPRRVIDFVSRNIKVVTRLVC